MTALRMEDVSVTYGAGRSALHAVRGVTIDVAGGETVGLVGESGCGKSSLAKAGVGLVPLTGGRIMLDGVDVATPLRRRRIEALRRVQLIFQDPHASLNPRMTVGETLAEAVSAHHRLGRAAVTAQVHRMLDLVGLPGAAARRRPREFSGGQKQRIAIARALAVGPSVLIADEITSALDVSVQAAILNLLRTVQRETGVACLFISHDLSVVRYVSDRVAVMHLGRVVEHGPTKELFAAPQHPYTRVLLDSVPTLTRAAAIGRTRALREPVDPHEVPSGCDFRTRCPVGPEADASRTRCGTEPPVLAAAAAAPDHHVACHFPLRTLAATVARTPSVAEGPLVP